MCKPKKSLKLPPFVAVLLEKKLKTEGEEAKKDETKMA